jgi:2-amino-4-hydroxy-6-hydroxymethyldihydropteridine diphosphokinase
MTHHATICLGSNTSDRADKLSAALSAIGIVAEITAQGIATTSPDITGRGDDYLNMVITCTTNLALDHFSETLGKIESRLGRTPQSKSIASMPIDIDIVVWDNNIISEADFSRSYFTLSYASLKSKQ